MNDEQIFKENWKHCAKGWIDCAEELEKVQKLLVEACDIGQTLQVKKYIRENHLRDQQNVEK